MTEKTSVLTASRRKIAYASLLVASSLWHPNLPMNSIFPASNVRHCLQLLLLVSAVWITPLPVVHSHGSVIHWSPDDAELTQHLLRHHHEASWSNDGCHWHVHWVLFGSAYAGINGEAAMIQSVAHSSLSNAVVDFPSLGLCAAAWVALLCDSYRLIADGTLSGANWLSGRALCRISVPTISSVMRC